MDGVTTTVDGTVVQTTAQTSQTDVSTATQVQTPAPVVQATTKPATTNVPMFTQEQVNDLIRGRVNDLNKTIGELTQELSTTKSSSASFLTELNSLKQTSVLSKLGIQLEVDGKPNPMLDFLNFEIGKNVSDTKPFDVVAKEYIEGNPWLLTSQGSTQQTQTQAQAPAQSAGITQKTVTGSTGFVPQTVEGKGTDVISSVLEKRGYKIKK